MSAPLLNEFEQITADASRPAVQQVGGPKGGVGASPPPRVPKPFIPFAWSTVFDRAGLAAAERLVTLYAMASAYWDRDASSWLVVWPVIGVAKLAGVDRDACTRAKKKLKAAELIDIAKAGDRLRHVSETWDVTKLMETK